MNKSVSEDEAIALAGAGASAFSGSDFLATVGYMDPGTGPQHLAEGAQFYYTFLSVGIISRLMVIFLTN